MVNPIRIGSPIAAPLETGPFHRRDNVLRQVHETLPCVFAHGERVAFILLVRQSFLFLFQENDYPQKQKYDLK